jgi:hypothetical protein
MTDLPRIVHCSLPGLTPDQARIVRARCWDFVFQCWQKKQKAAEISGGENGRKEINDSPAACIIPEQP